MRINSVNVSIEGYGPGSEDKAVLLRLREESPEHLLWKHEYGGDWSFGSKSSPIYSLILLLPKNEKWEDGELEKAKKAAASYMKAWDIVGCYEGHSLDMTFVIIPLNLQA